MQDTCLLSINFLTDFLFFFQTFGAPQTLVQYFRRKEKKVCTTARKSNLGDRPSQSYSTHKAPEGVILPSEGMGPSSILSRHNNYMASSGKIGISQHQHTASKYSHRKEPEPYLHGQLHFQSIWEIQYKHRCLLFSFQRVKIKLQFKHTAITHIYTLIIRQILDIKFSPQIFL